MGGTVSIARLHATPAEVAFLYRPPIAPQPRRCVFRTPSAATARHALIGRTPGGRS
jgi:hypothetical protein